MSVTAVITPFELLYSDLPMGSSLPAELQQLYGGDLALPIAGDAARPAISTNFVVSHDGRISFDLPGRRGGNPISGRSRHDHWLMELLRARADAILVGATTLRAAPRHAWQPGELCGQPALLHLRTAEARRAWPDLVVLTAGGAIPVQAAAFNPARRVFILTGQQGAAQLPSLPANCTVLPELDTADGLSHLLRRLYREFGITTLLSEGGGRTYGSLLAARMVDDVFLTRSPLIVGNPAAPAAMRPSLVEGIAFTPDNAPRLQLRSLRRADNLLFEHLQLVSTQTAAESARIRQATA